MTRFEDELHHNNFVCSKCLNCNHWVWPPSEFCNKCLGGVNWLPVSKNAILVESSSKGDTHFCIAEFENSIRVIGTICGPVSNLVPGQNLILTNCTYDKTAKFVFKLE
jgi:uncharacterized OB-fold protein